MFQKSFIWFLYVFISSCSCQLNYRTTLEAWGFSIFGQIFGRRSCGRNHPDALGTTYPFEPPKPYEFNRFWLKHIKQRYSNWSVIIQSSYDELWIIEEHKKGPGHETKQNHQHWTSIQWGLRNLQAIHDVNELLQPDPLAEPIQTSLQSSKKAQRRVRGWCINIYKHHVLIISCASHAFIHMFYYVRIL